MTDITEVKMSRSTELWETIQGKISEENLLNSEELTKLEGRILSNRVTEDDWSTSILNSTRMEAENEQQQ